MIHFTPPDPKPTTLLLLASGCWQVSPAGSDFNQEQRELLNPFHNGTEALRNELDK